VSSTADASRNAKFTSLVKRTHGVNIDYLYLGAMKKQMNTSSLEESMDVTFPMMKLTLQACPSFSLTSSTFGPTLPT
jgi:hypothetical protein